MTTPKELADKARAYLLPYRHAPKDMLPELRDEFHATIDQLQAMAEARQGGGEPVVRGRLEDVSPGQVAHRICRDVAELPDRSSPADWPEAMLVTSDELHQIVMTQLKEFDAPPSAQQATGSGQVLTEANAAHAKNLRRLADIGKDCGRLVSKDGRAWADMHAAADAIDATTTERT